jgi:signal transduction histidine kinase
MILILVASYLFLPGGTIYAEEGYSTILTAERTNETITIDGFAKEASWSDAKKLVVEVQDGSLGKVEVVLRALYDAEYIYIYATWPDPTESIDKSMWTFNGSEWASSGDEDRFAIIWNIDDSVRGFNIAGCAMVCHGDRMHTNAPGERGDLWHWKAARTNPLGYADDMWIDNTLVEGYDEEAKEAALHRDSTESLLEGLSVGYIRNVNESGDAPRYYKPKLGEEDRFLFWEDVEKGEVLEVAGNEFERGYTVPGYLLRRPTGSQGDIDAKGTWRNGRWTVEFRRRLQTGNPDDVQFDVSKTYRFGIAVMDNTSGFKAYGKGHSFDLGARTLEFGGPGMEEVTQLTLIKDYLIAAGAYAEEKNPGLAISTISDAYSIYRTIRHSVADRDPALHLAIVNGFVENRRNPTPENINAIIKKIDEATLTLQGKKEPEKPTWGMRLLAFWGSIQLYVFILLSVLVVYPLYKTIQTARKPELRWFGLFLFIVILPIFLEGLGRFGVLLNIHFLQKFSFTTSEYITLLWAMAMFVALFIARAGFYEVDDTIHSLRTYSEELLKSNELKEMFTDILRHDMLNPAGITKGMTELALMEEKDPEKRSILLEILESNEKLIDIIKSASKLAKLESIEKQELRKEDLGYILRRIVKDISHLAKEKNMKIKIKARGKFPALVNPLIYDVFSNLLSNAIKYSPENSDIIVVIEDDGQNWKISVEDYGEGIPDEYKEAIFERFKRVKKRGVKGTGLGLAIVKKVVELHGGKVWVEDNIMEYRDDEGRTRVKKQGSIFYVTIPKGID